MVSLDSPLCPSVLTYIPPTIETTGLIESIIADRFADTFGTTRPLRGAGSRHNLRRRNC